MSQQDDKQRTKRERIERLRQRIATMTADQTRAILQGILDLLADEL